MSQDLFHNKALTGVIGCQEMSHWWPILLAVLSCHVHILAVNTGQTHTVGSCAPTFNASNSTDAVDLIYEIQPDKNLTENKTTFLGLPHQSEFWEEVVSRAISAYSTPILLVLGVTGNILCIVVLTNKSPMSSTSLYLVNLSVADLTETMVSLVSRHIIRSFTGFDTLSLHPAACKIFFGFLRSSQTISVWILVAVTLERMLVVYLPLKAKIISTRKIAWFAMGGIDIAGFLINSHFYWTWGAKTKPVTNSTDFITIAHCTLSTKHPIWMY